ncbi:MAG: FAD-dependent thymidylate synthase [Defluviitaleaceae bacterium]|nr:FAD-dependent thymidylate synthase [Defluviitaleaceae bacterium]MCL2238653.1 FAD-dependent thymidylate synthase [Defluviitaleaceae bacterium]
MKIIPPTFEIIGTFDGVEMLKDIELAGRTCYKSEAGITEDSAAAFVRRLIKRGHESVVEHGKATVKIICDRGVTHEIVRHRIASYSQESTRYCNYAKDKFGNELTFIRPYFWDEDGDKYRLWQQTMQDIEAAYMKLLDLGATPEEARSVLPNSLKTEIITTMNMRQWRHFFKLRTDKASHPQMREIARPLLDEFKRRVPALFDDIK